MKKFRNIAIFAVAMLLVFALGVGSTIAYFYSNSGIVTNTFNPAKFGTPTVSEDTPGPYPVVPGVDITKDPRVTYKVPTSATQEPAEAYIYLEIKLTGGWTMNANYNQVTRQIGDDVSALSFNLNTANWQYLGTASGNYIYVYVKDGNIVKVKTNIDDSNGIPVIDGDKVTVSPDIEKDDMEKEGTSLGDVTFKSYAVQVEGLGTPKGAWNTVYSANQIP